MHILKHPVKDCGMSRKRFLNLSQKYLGKLFEDHKYSSENEGAFINFHEKSEESEKYAEESAGLMHILKHPVKDCGNVP